MVAGAGNVSQPAIVPVTVARPRTGAEIARSAIVRLVPLAPIQVPGAWPDADTVSVTGFVSSLQPVLPLPPSAPPPADVKRASPV